MAADVKFAVKSFALSTAAATNTQDVTVTSFGTVKAAIFILSGGTVDGTPAAHINFSVGFSDGTNDQASGIHFADNVSTSNSSRSTTHSGCMILPSPDGATVVLKFSVDSFITDGVRLYINNAAESAFLATCILIGGSDVSNAFVGYDIINGSGANPVTSPGFEPDMIFGATCCYRTPTQGEDYPEALISVSAALNDGFEKQRTATIFQDDAYSGGSRITSVIHNDAVGVVHTTTLNMLYQLTSFDATGFTLDPTSNAVDAEFGFLALKFTNNPGISLFDVSIPTTGNYEETAPGFEPNFCFLATAVGVDTLNTVQSDADLGGLGITAFDASTVNTVSAVGEATVSTKTADSQLVSNFELLNNDATDYVVSSGYTMDSGGFTATLTTNPTVTLLGWGLAFGTTAAATGRIMSSLTNHGGLAGPGGIAGIGGGLAG